MGAGLWALLSSRLPLYFGERKKDFYSRVGVVYIFFVPAKRPLGPALHDWQGMRTHRARTMLEHEQRAGPRSTSAACTALRRRPQPTVPCSLMTRRPTPAGMRTSTWRTSGCGAQGAHAGEVFTERGRPPAVQPPCWRASGRGCAVCLQTAALAPARLDATWPCVFNFLGHAVLCCAAPRAERGGGWVRRGVDGDGQAGAVLRAAAVPGAANL